MTRQIGIADAVLLGLGGMLGAGVFAGFAPAAATAGYWVLPALLLPAALAYCSAISSAAQAAACPGVGAGYLATAESLGVWPGRLSGVLFVASRSAAAAAVAGVLGDYLYPAQPKLVAILALALVIALNGLGVRVPALVDRLLAGLVIAVLLVLIATSLAVAAPPPPAADSVAGNDIRGFPAAAAIMYFAFAGFDRLSGPGGEADRVRRIAVPVLIGVALLLYLAVGFGLLRQLGQARLALSPVPLRDALGAADASALEPLLLLAAPAAMLPVLLGLQGGARDVLRAMHDTGDLWFPGGGRAARGRFDAVAGLLAALAVLTVSPVTALVFAVACALTYSMFANAAARVLLRDEHPLPTRTACVGMVLSVVPVMTLPVGDLAAVLLICAAGAALTAASAARARYRSRL